MSSVCEQAIKLDGSSSHFNQANSTYIGHPSLQDELDKVPEFNEAWLKANKFCKKMGLDCSFDSLAKCCWTISDPPFYKLVNEKLREWHHTRSPDTLFPFNNYVKLLESQCVKLPNMMTFYRGIDNKNLLSLIHEEKYLTSPCMYSCSENEETAISFAELGTLLKIETNYAIPIVQYSKFPNEEEYLIPPGMFFEVLKYEKDPEGYDFLHVKLAQVKIFSFVRPDLALQISDLHVKMARNDPNNIEQLWIIQGRYIRNANNGYALYINYLKSITGQAKRLEGKKVFAFKLDCEQNQEWFYTDELVIENGIDNLVMHIENREGKVADDSHVVVKYRNHSNNQLFKINFC